VKLDNDSDDSDVEDSSRAITLDRTKTGIISNRRPKIGTPALSGTTTPSTEASGGATPRHSIMAAAKQEAARRKLYSMFFRGPVLGTDMDAEPVAESSQAAQAREAERVVIVEEHIEVRKEKKSKKRKAREEGVERAKREKKAKTEMEERSEDRDETKREKKRRRREAAAETGADASRAASELAEDPAASDGPPPGATVSTGPEERRRRKEEKRARKEERRKRREKEKSKEEKRAMKEAGRDGVADGSALASGKSERRKQKRDS